jgi:hypothetical protein
MKEITKHYTGYVVSRCIAEQGVELGYKHNAEFLNGIRFSHHMYFYWSCQKNANCTINGRFAVFFEPGFNHNYYQANFVEGVVLSRDMKTFSIQPHGLNYIYYKPITIEEIKQLHPDVQN